MPRTSKSKVSKVSKKQSKFSGVSPTYSPYSNMPSYQQNTSKYAVEHELMNNGLSLPPSRKKRAEIAKLVRYGIPIPQMTKDDAQCAARFPQFSAMNKVDVLALAAAMGVDTNGMAKIDGCHALHQMGVDTEHDPTNGVLTVFAPELDDSVSFTTSGGPARYDLSKSKEFAMWKCERPEEMMRTSCGKTNDGVPTAKGFENQTWMEQASCENACNPPNQPLQRVAAPWKPAENPYRADQLDQLDQIRADKDQNIIYGDLLSELKASTNKAALIAQRNAAQGKKCRRSKVNGNLLMRDKKGRFCKKSKKMMKRRSRK